MIVDLPSTDTSAVNRTMVDLRESAGAVALGRVLTLLIITEDGPEAEAAIQAANDASREHPCRVLVLARGIRRAASRLDAQIRIGGDAGASEVIVLRMYGPLADQGGAIVVPLLLPDAPIVAWWPGEAPTSPSEDPVGSVAGRRITDVGSAKSPSKALAKLRQRYAPGRHRPRLEPHHQLARPARPPPSTSPARPRDARGGGRRARLGVGRPAHRLAGLPPRLPGLPHDPGRAGRSGRADRDRCASSARTGRSSWSASTRRARCSPSPGSPTVASPSPGAPPASAWPRSCAGSTRTTSTPRPSRRCRRPAGGPRAPRRGEGGRMSTPEVVVHPDTDTTASDAADRLITALAAAQAARGTASVVLTGGGVGIAMLRAGGGPPPGATPSTGVRSRCSGATSASSPPATPSATTPRPARPCSTRCRSTRRGCTRWRPPTPPRRPAAATRTSPPTSTPRRSRRRRRGSAATRSRPSTCCSPAAGRRATCCRCSRTRPRCTRRRPGWSPSATAPSRRRPASR